MEKQLNELKNKFEDWKSKNPVKEDKRPYYCIDSKEHKELVEAFKILVRYTTKYDFQKIMVITIDNDGAIRPLFIDPTKGCDYLGDLEEDCCVNSSRPFSDDKALLRQNVLSILTCKPNADLFCWPTARNKWKCRWI